MRTIILGFGLLILAILVFLAAGRYSYLMGYLQIEILIGIFALIAFGIGMAITKNLKEKNNVSAVLSKTERNINDPDNKDRKPCKSIKEFNLTQREIQVLKEITKGLSNQEIAQKLFLSESTVKTHVSGILFKLNAKRRTEVMLIAQELADLD